MTGETRYDVCIVGAGLVGLATADAMARTMEGLKILVIDKEDRVAHHQSGHNSGVIHSGLYYRPGSLKARLCVEGRDAIYRLADGAGIAVRRSGKVVVATDETELPSLEELARRGKENGLQGLRLVGRDELTAFEPAATGVAALLVPEAGVVDFPAVARELADRLRGRGGVIATGERVLAITHRVDGVSVATEHQQFETRCLVNCAGLFSDRVASMAGVEPRVRIVPFRGQYYQLTDSAAHLVRSLVYPVPDPRFPFLGVHFTRRVDDTVEVGPNAVLALGREQYAGVPPDWGELISLARYGGFRRLVGRHWASGVRELANSWSARRYARVARRLIPDVTEKDLTPGGVGVRAQAVDSRGNLVDDFVIQRAGSTVHVLNAPSPGATASPAIGEHIARLVRPILEG